MLRQVSLLAPLAAFACVAASPTGAPATSTRTASLTGVANIRDYGAVCDGVTDDRAAIQAALDGSTDVLIPSGRCAVGQGAGYWGIYARAGTRIHGESRDGAVLVQLPVPSNVRLLEIDVPNVTVDTLTFDGAYPTQPSLDEHRAGIFAHAATGLTIRNVTSKFSTGDGIYIHAGTNAPVIDNVLLTQNVRNGITFGGGTTGGTVTASQFSGNGAQQFDSEPGAGYTVDGLSISGCTFDGAGASAQFVLTIAGGDMTHYSKGWMVSGNIFKGPVEVIQAQDITLRGNTIRQPFNAAALLIYHGNARINVVDNDIALTGATGPEVVGIIGTGINQASSEVVLSRNTITAGAANAFGVHIVTARSVEVSDNVLTGNGVTAPYTAGVYARQTLVGEDLQALIVRRNRIAAFGAYGVSTAPAPGVIKLVTVSGNTFVGPNPMKGLALAGNDLRQNDNDMYGGVTQMLSSTPAGTWQAWGNGDRWVTP